MTDYLTHTLKQRETAFRLALEFANHPEHYPKQYTVHNAVEQAKEIYQYLNENL